MRTTLTLDDDVAAKLRIVVRRTGRPFRDVVNETLRRGLVSERPAKREAFRITARSLGGVQPGVRLDNIGELLDQIEGPRHR